MSSGDSNPDLAHLSVSYSAPSATRMYIAVLKSPYPFFIRTGLLKSMAALWYVFALCFPRIYLLGVTKFISLSVYGLKTFDKQ